MNIYDVVIVGAGPVGMQVANMLKDENLQVAILDEAQSVGGQIYRDIEKNCVNKDEKLLGKDYYVGELLLRQFYQNKNLTYIKNVIVWSIDKAQHIFYSDGEKSYQIEAKKIVLALGAYERPYLINGWDLPGVMSASSAQIMLKSSKLIQDNAIFIGTGPLMYYILDQYLKAGAKIKAFIDTNPMSNYVKVATNVKAVYSAFSNVPQLIKGLSFLKL